MDNDIVLNNLVKNLKEDNRCDGDIYTFLKRDGEPMEEEVQSPSKVLRLTTTRKVPRRDNDI